MLGICFITTFSQLSVSSSVTHHYVMACACGVCNLQHHGISLCFGGDDSSSGRRDRRHITRHRLLGLGKHTGRKRSVRAPGLPACCRVDPTMESSPPRLTSPSISTSPCHRFSTHHRPLPLQHDTCVIMHNFSSCKTGPAGPTTRPTRA
ncbi:hypothetical protein B0T14DRAFT_51948 [Immersiella caudata]|uniref:Secreted protein n=1 Tax=Immersiella caudata TaxID=314043 RepID=A0AA39XGT5_9PEZI|nr:hypothetical protein B0T14DRAFT_51948 [Immersiella caudata]